MSSASGLLDAEIVDEVGFALYARCLSMLQVAEAIRGRPVCPKCAAPCSVRDKRTPDAIIVCSGCDWACALTAYQKTYQRKGLFAGGMEPFIRGFVEQFALAREPGERMVLIDTLIHRFHWESDGQASGRPGATSFIEGTMTDIVAFLDRLSYGDAVPAGLSEQRAKWRMKWEQNPWANGRGQKVGKPTSSGS